MATEADPVVDNWYSPIDKGQQFKVIAVDEDLDLIEIQFFDGDIAGISFDEWYDLEIEVCEEPENWSGPVDITELDDFGTEITETSAEDWDEPLQELH